MNQEPLPQIHLIRDTDLSVFAYELHIFAGDFLRECEFNMRSLATNTGADSIAIMGKNHIWLSDALFAYCSTADLYQMISTTEFIGARAFLFHTDRREGVKDISICVTPSSCQLMTWRCSIPLPRYYIQPLRNAIRQHRAEWSGRSDMRSRWHGAGERWIPLMNCLDIL